MMMAVSHEADPLHRPNVERPRSIGLVGGLGVGATVLVYKALVAACLSKGFSPTLTVAHADVGHVLALAGSRRTAELASYLADVIGTLAGAGAQVAAIPALTPHLCFPDLVKISPVPLVNMLTLTAEEVRRRGLSRVALFGTRTTIETALFGALKGIHVLQPPPEEVELIHTTYVSLVQDGHGTPERAATLRALANTFMRRDGAEAIILAGTELALLFDERSTDFPAVDCGHLLVDALATQAFPQAIGTLRHAI